MTKFKGLARASASAIALSAALLAVPAAAAELRGRVYDEISKSALPGAVISVDGTALSATASRDGSFSFPNLKPGIYKIKIEYVGYPDKAMQVSIGAAAPETLSIPLVREETIEAVTVTGMRQAERVALQVKRSDDAIVETLYSNDVGKLPDQNVAEAVRRLPGVTVANDQGEGRYAVIRGAAPNLANVTVNGQTAPAPEADSRQVKLDDIPASLIGSLTVNKTLTADMDANAIAGAIDITTLSAFDRSSGFLYGRVSTGVYNLSGLNPYEIDLTGGNTFGANDQFGLVLSANYSTRPINSENFGSGGPSWTNGIPNNMQIRDYNLNRIRAGAVLNFDWHASEHLDLFARTTFSSFSDKETRDRFTVTTGTVTGSTFTGGAGTRYVRSREEDDHTINFSTGGKYTLGENIFKLEATYSEAIKTDPRRDEWTFKGPSKITGTLNLSQFTYLVTPDASAYDPAQYAFSGLKKDHREAAENLFQLRGDYERALSIFDGDSSLKAGFKWSERVKKYDVESLSYKASKSSLTMATLVSGTPVGYYGAKKATYDGRYTFGPRVDYTTAEAYFAANYGNHACDTSAAGGFVCDPVGSASASASSDYNIKEDIIAGYVMANLKFGKLQLIPGVRVEATDGTYASKAVATTVSGGVPVITPNSTKNSYLDVFPGINARYDVTEDMVLRGAVTTAIGRPDYNEIPAYVVVDTTMNQVSMGNPNLKPLRSRNFDLSAEYYLPGQGIIALSAFYKDIDDPIYAQSVLSTGTFGGYALSNATVSSFFNAGSGEIKGLELNISDQFTFLPGALNGLGASANFALIDSKATGIPGRSDVRPLAQQSKYVSTLQVFYEKYGFTARLAYSYRSKWLDTLGTSKASDVYTLPNGQLDARISYDIADNFTIFTEGANLNGARWRRYIGSTNQAYESERYSWSIRSGIQIKL
ncbi:TonB-dependent receptor [Rhizomicrobium palustre]|uniref:TonB-dependent receptor n=1 Tax=Rhizomicrobium palustre TaxID=189966 RepID=A0A846MWV3_9PROT|nr:TonB-dependent receptor [Rhizomicrobium palustre]NIK87719.1 TonB-dependent receptor [Rhizomicrobium palustre]